MNVTGEKMQITLFPNLGPNPVHWTLSHTLYHVATKASLYHKEIQVYYIPIPGDILPLQIEICPWISSSPRIMWDKSQGILMYTRGLIIVEPQWLEHRWLVYHG